MANPFDTLGIPLEEKEKQQSNITSTSSITVYPSWLLRKINFFL